MKTLQLLDQLKRSSNHHRSSSLLFQVQHFSTILATPRPGSPLLHPARPLIPRTKNDRATPPSFKFITASLSYCETLESLCTLLKSYEKRQLNEINKIAALTRFSKLSATSSSISAETMQESQDLICKIAIELSKRISSFTIRDVNSILLAVNGSYSIMKSNPEKYTALKNLVHASVFDHAKIILPKTDLNSESLFFLCSNISRARSYSDPKLMEQISRKIQSNPEGLLSSLDMYQVIVILRCFISFLPSDHQIFRVCFEQLKTKPIDRSTIALGLAQVLAGSPIRDENLNEKLVSYFLSSKNTSSLRALSSLVDSLSTLNIDNPELYNNIERACVDEIATRQPDNEENIDYLRTLCLGFARIGKRTLHSNLFALIATHCSRCTEQQLDAVSKVWFVDMLWSFARTNQHMEQHFYKLLCEKIVSRDLSTLEEKTMRKLLWSLCSLKFQSIEVLEQMENVLLSRDLSTVSNDLLVSVIRSWATLNFKNERSSELMKLIAREFSTRDLSTIGLTELVYLVWGFAWAGLLRDSNVLACLNKTVSVNSKTSTDEIEDGSYRARLFKQALDAWRIEYPDLKLDVNNDHPPELLSNLSSFFDVSVPNTNINARESHMNSVVQVMEKLETCGCICELNVFTPQGLVVDLKAVTANGEELYFAFVDRNVHVARGEMLNGFCALQTRLLQKTLANVKTIHVDEWLRKTSSQRMEMVERLVSSGGA